MCVSPWTGLGRCRERNTKRSYRENKIVVILIPHHYTQGIGKDRTSSFCVNYVLQAFFFFLNSKENMGCSSLFSFLYLFFSFFCSFWLNKPKTNVISENEKKKENEVLGKKIWYSSLCLRQLRSKLRCRKQIFLCLLQNLLVIKYYILL